MTDVLRIRTDVSSREGPEEKNLGWDFVGNRLAGRPVLFTHKTVDGFHGITHPLIVDRIVHILTVLIGYQYARILQDPKMLGGNGLLNLEGVVNLVDLDILVLIQKFQNL